VHLGGASWGALAAILLFGSLTAAGMGLVLGTGGAPNRISVVFALVLTPLIFTAATFYPWSSLARCAGSGAARCSTR
jgi:ABC-2 type transport system permease protein